MWKAEGSPATKRTIDWLRLGATQDLLKNYISKSGATPLLDVDGLIVGIPCVLERKPGRYGGTYATPQLATDYAQVLSVDFHEWALNALVERIEEESNPELAYNRGRERAVKGWKRQGRSDDWIQDRVNGIENYKQHTSVLHAHGVKAGKTNGFASCADAINENVLGFRSKKAKVVLGLTKKSARLRDSLSRLQLTALSFAEAMADDDIAARSLHGNIACRDACSKAAERVVVAAKGATRIKSA
ncbi:KilA-N domain-containing protein [Stenomitos frigidus]|uniref:KilA/APSES-type HTH DNA-binding domain-containing protein n=1 Tax=Stenomitos frigidus ULC18 TaxID=2107698 RepID=A0A2T1DV16_9CYAN|nr:KilA-N domain-containing protein [Stenomitos frigidus]PSB24271.1 hypothetical protein C7B82_27715 [Stenomitos frigidus ULC18]